MPKFVNQGESIEGQKVLINTRKQIFQIIIRKNNKTLHKYKCSKNAKAEITEELNPKNWLIKETSHLNLGDTLEADVLELLSIEQLRFQKEPNYSSTHGIQTAAASDFTFAEIYIPFRFVLERVTS